jgi:hypothetical protein
MIRTCCSDEISSLGPTDLSDALEGGDIVYFPRSPVAFPSEEDLRFLREEMPRSLKGKNVSYHPELGRVVGVRGAWESRGRLRRVLKEHSREVQAFLARTVPGLVPGWKVGTSSFRPLQERGRVLHPHASNERVHVDARAYGATHGDRILRFFMNANPFEDRVWVTKGAFPEVYRRYGRAAGIAPAGETPRNLGRGLAGRLFSGLLGAISYAGLPTAQLLDTSPYDRLMRRFHNYMKDTPEFQEAAEGHRQFSFGPLSAWMVFTDTVTHACLSGQHAFIDTFIVPLRNCRFPELAPYHILEGRTAPDRCA